jgi:hypothetical protein
LLLVGVEVVELVAPVAEPFMVVAVAVLVGLEQELGLP